MNKYTQEILNQYDSFRKHRKEIGMIALGASVGAIVTYYIMSLFN